MRIKWTDEMDSKLLRAVVKKAKLTGKDHAELAAFMGNGIDAVSIKNHLYHLVLKKRDGDNTPNGSPAKSKTASGNSPGNGKGKSPAKPSRPTVVKKRKYCDEDEDEDDAGDSADCATPTPAKRVKVEKDITVKTENSGYDDEVV